jgi:hypothetical protein
MKKSPVSAVILSIAYLSAVLAFSPSCWAVFVYFDGSAGSDFLAAANWTPETPPGANLVDIYAVDDGLAATISSNTTTRINGLRVGSAAKEHFSGEIHSGTLTMTEGTLEVIGNNLLVIGRENPHWYSTGGDYNQNSVVDAADYTVWRDTVGSSTDFRADGDESNTIDQADYIFWKNRFGNVVRGGGFTMTGSSILRAYGLLVGERTKGVFTIGPDAMADIRIWDTTVMPNQFGGTEDMRVGGYGPVFDIFGSEPGLAGDGLVDVQGTLNAKDMYVSEHGAKGELRVTGGTVNLNGRLLMDFCGGCGTDPVLLAQRSSKVTIVGSGGSLNVGVDPDPLVVDPMPPLRDLLAASPTALFSFTADAGGISPIVLADNGAEPSGTAYLTGSKLQLNLDAYTSATPLTLIDAAAGMIGSPPHPHIVGTFGNVTFLGSRKADVVFDEPSGNMILTNFRIEAGSGSLAGASVPEPSSLVLIVVMGCFLLGSGVGFDRQRALKRGLQCQRISA